MRNKPTNLVSSRTSNAVISLFICTLMATLGQAQSFTWNGASPSSDDWNDAANWTSVFAPPTGPTVFGGDLDFFFTGAKTTSEIDVDWTVTRIDFVSGVTAMTFSGQTLTVLEHGIFNNDNSTQTFNNTDISFEMLGVAGGSDISVLATSGDLDFNAKILVADGMTLDVGGANDVFFDGGITKSTTVSATMTVNKTGAGQLRLQDNSTGIEELNINGGSVVLANSPSLSSSLNVQMSSGTVFNLNNNSTNINILSGSGSVQLGSGSLTVGHSTDFTYSGVISGTGGLAKDSSGIFTLEGANTYSGATNISGGTLRLASGGSLSSSTDMSISSGATFDVNNHIETVDSISGAGTIQLGGGTIAVDEASGTRTFSGNILESGELQKDGGGTLVLSGSNEFTFLDLNAGTIQVSSQGNLGLGTIDLGAGTLQTTASFTNSRTITTTSLIGGLNVNSGTTLTQNGVISGTGSLNKSGDGTLVLGANNNYTGGTNISDGILRLGSSNRIGNSSDVTLASGATFQLNNSSDTVASISGTGGNVDSGGTSGRLSVNATIGTFTYSGTFMGTGGFDKQGGHTLIIAGANSNSGATNITGGTLQLSGSGSLGNDSDINISGATWDLNGVNDTVDSISGSGNILLGGSTLVVDENGGSRTFSGNISEAGSFAKSGTHTLTLSGNNTFDGELSISAGTLSVGTSSNLGAATTNVVFFGGTLQTTGSFTNARSVVIGPFNTATFNTNASTTLTQSGTITGDSTTTLTKTGGGTLQFTAANAADFSGDIIVNDGTFDMAGGGNALGNSTTVTVNSPAAFLVNNADDIGGLAGSGSVVLNQTLNVGFENTSTTFSGVISGTGQFGKRGTGTLTLSGNNTYTGPTDIDAGVLQLSGAGRLSDMTDVDVAAGATFDLNDISDALDALTGAGSVTLGAGTSNALTIGSNNGGGTFSGSISGTGSLIKVGNGTQIFTGNNTWSAGTQINGGVVRVSSTSTNLGSGSIQLDGGTLEATATLSNVKGIVLNAGGGTLDVDTGTTFTMAAGTPISGTGSLTKADAGALVLSANSTYGGDTFITGGLLQLTSSGRLPDTSNVSISGVATWDLNGLSDTVQSIFGAGDILLGGATLTVTQNGGSRTFSGVLSEAGGLTKTGTHTLTLAGPNTFTGNVAINGGTLQFDSNDNLGNTANDLSFNGGTLYQLPGIVDLGTGRSITLNAGGGTVFLEAGATLTIPGVIGGTGGINVVSDNEETLVLSGVNSYSGGTTIVDAFVDISQNANLGNNSGSVTLTNGLILTDDTFTNLHPIILDGGTSGFAVTGATLTQSAGISGVGTLSISGTGTLLLTVPAAHAGNTLISSNSTLQFGSGELPDAFDVTVNNATSTWDLNGVSDTIDGLFGAGTVLLGGGTLTVGSADGNGNFSGSIQEAGAFVKTGSGVQVLSGANTYTTSTTIDEGTLEIVGNSSLGAVSASLIFNDGTLRSTSTFSTGRTTTINSSATFDVAPGTTLTFTSPIGGDGELNKINDGILELTQANTYAGVTRIDEGTLRLSGGGLLADTTDVFVESGATFDATDIVDSIDSLTGGGDVLLGLGTLTIGSNDGVGTFSGVISGVGGALVKEGAGTEIFTGINTYTGGTDINGGVLQVSQSENLGSLGTLLSFDGGTLHTTASFDMIRGISLGVGGGIIDVDAGTTLDASGNITGVGGSLTKIGDGILALSGLSTYDGGTFIYGGTVEIGDANDLGNTAGALTIDGGTLRTVATITTARATIIGPGVATIDTNSLTTLTLTGPISGNAGPAGFTKAGDGTLRLQTANSFIAAIRLTGGLFQVSASNQLGDVGNSIDLLGGSLNTLASFTNPRIVRIGVGGGGINVAIGTTFTQSGVIQDDTIGLVGGLTKDGGGVLLTTASNTYTGPTAINAGTVRLSGAGRLPDVTDVTIAGNAFFDLNNVSDAIDALGGTGDITLGSGFLSIGANDGGATYTGTISGTGGLVKIGAGTQLLRTKTIGMDTFPNTYSGGTAINGGVLDVEENESIGNPSGPLSFAGGTLQVQGDTAVNSARAVTLNVGGGTINTVGQDASVTFSGVATGPGFLRKNGAGRFTLSAANTYTGDTIINGGILRLEGAGRLPDASNVTVEASGILGEGLDLNDISDAINGLEGGGDIHLGSGTLTVGSAGAGGDFDGVIDGTGGFVKVGAGSQILVGANTYSGGTAINGGELEINANNNLGNPAGSLSFNGGTIVTTDTFSMSRLTTMNAGGGTFSVTGANILTHDSVISGNGGLGKSNTGTLVLNGPNNYTGPTNITGGTLRLGGVERLANETDVSVAAGAVWDLNNFNETVDSLSGAGSVQLGGAQLVVGFDSGSGSFTGVLSGSGDLLKEGAGTQTLSGTNTYSGATFVDRGELILTGGGSISQATLVTGFNIGSDGTTTIDGASTTWHLTGNLLVGFDGTGQMNITDGATITVEGDVTIGGNGIPGTLSLDMGTLDNSAGNGVAVTTGSLAGHGTVVGDVFNQDTVSPGNSAGILELTGSYIQDITGLLSIEIGGSDNTNPLNPQFDVLDVSGTASLAGQLELALINGFTPAPSDTFTILTTSSRSGVFSNVADGARLDISGGGTGSFLVDYTANSIILSDFIGVGGGIPGDFDNDGDVDGRDFLIWQRGGSPNPLSAGDLGNWQGNYGVGSPLSANVAAPEPTTLTWMTALVLLRTISSRFCGRTATARGAWELD